MSRVHILVVDDDTELRAVLGEYLLQQGFNVSAAESGVAMRSILESNVIDLVVLDLMLPVEGGLSLVRWLREQGDLPIIMMSARGDDIDRIVGLEVGADDYLAKPFNPRELLARIRAVLRRQIQQPPTADEDNNHHFGPFMLDIDSRSLLKNGTHISLTGGDYSLLQVFTENPRRVLSRDRLLSILKGYECGPYDRSIDVRVTRLRKKLEADPAEPRYIRTVWGEGYMFTPDGNQ